MQQRTPSEVLGLAKNEGVEIVDLRFCDLPGLMQHFSIPVDAADRGRVRRGLRLRRFVDPGIPGDPGVGHAPLPGSRHGRPRPVPQPTRPSISTASSRDPVTGEPYTRDPRYVAQKAEAYLLRRPVSPTPPTSGRRRSSSSSTTCASTTTSTRRAHSVDSDRGQLEHRPRRGTQPRLQDPLQGGVLPRPPDGPLPGPALRDDPHACSGIGIEIEVQHHEVGDRRSGRDRHALRHAPDHGRQAHALQVRGEERRRTPPVTRRRSCPSRSSRTTARGCTCTRRCGRAASRCSTPRQDMPGLSDIGRWYIGGLLKHAPAILAFAAPTTNSLQASGARATRRRSTSCTASATGRPRAASRCTRRARRPSGSSSAAPTRRCNPYLAFSAILMAGLDGVQNRIEPPPPVDKDLYDLPPEELAKVPQVPGSLDESLACARGRQRLPEGRWRVHRRPHRDPHRLQAGATRSTPSASGRTPTSSRSTTTFEQKCPLACGFGVRGHSMSAKCPRDLRGAWRPWPLRCGLPRPETGARRRRAPSWPRRARGGPGRPLPTLRSG